ncbi:MAG TPA: ATP-dependent DNA helicase RecG [Acidimicrobiales bacterium]|nr:ATP-dependent DNA helicase RecG [Acidimicrobiales bacterium]
MTGPVPGATDAAHRLALLERTSPRELPRLGRRGADALAALGITSVLDLVLHYPRRYADRSATARIAELAEGVQASVVARVVAASLRRARSGRPFVEVELVDDDGGRLGCTFFNQTWRLRQLEPGAEVVVFGRVERFGRRLKMTNPRLDLVGAPHETRQTGRVVPIYPQSERAGVTSYQIARYVAEALAFAEAAGAFADPLSERRRAELGLVSRAEAFRSIHFPETLDASRSARRRLAFDELWRLQVALVLRRRALDAASRGIRHAVGADAPRGALVERFVASLPFPLTGAQTRVIAEVAADLARPVPMHRLLQGDVGAGKTVVALAALLYAVQGGHQGALMVPTEVLAEQHFLAARALLAGLDVPDARHLGGRRPVRPALLTSRTPAAERARLVAEARTGEVDLLVGTHALTTDDVAFASLGVVVIDEQHRFGVDQRAALREKGGGTAGGHDPDLLVMTATPIPRTAAMTVYGDLDLSVLDELPAGRAPVLTCWLDDPARHGEAWARVRAELEAGHQAYVVCPLVRAGGPLEEGAEDAEAEGGDAEDAGAEPAGAAAGGPDAAPRRARPLRAALEERARLATSDLSGWRLGLLHGQLPSAEKEATMAAFRAGELDVLVATTVVEVGVDVPNATVMVVEDADRFGIAQLHQLRGRVGRGGLASWCFLLSDRASAAASRRLAALVATSDGFELADVDLELRGEGTVLGTRQKGRNDLRLASLRRDRDLVVLARRLAEEIVDADPELVAHPRFREELRLFVGEEESAYLLRS